MFEIIKNCYERDNKYAILARTSDLAEPVGDALSELESVLKSELSDDGNFERGVLSQQAIEDAEKAVEDAEKELDDMVEELRELAPEASQHRSLFVARYGRAAVERSFDAAVEIVESERE
jgi:predicted S18 family serine protease